MQLSALKNLAIAIADASDPPLPRVVTRFSIEIPWNPVITGIPPLLIKERTSFVLIFFNRD